MHTGTQSIEQSKSECIDSIVLPFTITTRESANHIDIVITNAKSRPLTVNHIRKDTLTKEIKLCTESGMVFVLSELLKQRGFACEILHYQVEIIYSDFKHNIVEIRAHFPTSTSVKQALNIA